MLYVIYFSKKGGLPPCLQVTIPAKKTAKIDQIACIPEQLVQKRLRWFCRVAKSPEGELIKDLILPEGQLKTCATTIKIDMGPRIVYTFGLAQTSRVLTMRFICMIPQISSLFALLCGKMMGLQWTGTISGRLCRECWWTHKIEVDSNFSGQ